MPEHPPVVRRYVPPTAEQVAEAHATAEQMRAEAAATRATTEPARRAVILTGPVLLDVDAAVACHCACHPRPAAADLHGGGVSCPCQQTREERAAALESLFATSSRFARDLDADRFYEDRQERFDAEATALGVAARIQVWGAPLVIVGVCAGRGFYLRERHGSYRVTIAPDEDPASDPWAADATEPSIDIAAGDGDFADAGPDAFARALRVAVGAVRTALARNECEHRRVGSEPYCPSCGVLLAEAAAWRWSDPERDEPD